MSSRFLFSVLALASLGVGLSTLDAQDNNRPRGGAGGFGGFGGFGMGGFGGDPTLALIRMAEVKKEIEVVDDQEKDLAKLEEEARELMPRPEGNFREMSAEEREKVFAEMRKKSEAANKIVKEKLFAILLPYQQERFQQLAIQFRRTAALRDEEVARTLGLTAEQKTKLDNVQKEITEANMARMREFGGGPGGRRPDGAGDRKEGDKKDGGNADGNRQRRGPGAGGPAAGGPGGDFRERIAAMQKENDEKYLAVLTPEQKKKFEEMKGKPFQFPVPDFGGGRRPGGDNQNRRPERPAT